MISCYCFSLGSWDFSDWCELRSGLPTTRPCFEQRTWRAGRSPELDEQVGLDRGLRARLWQRLRHRSGSEIRSPESGCDVAGSRRHSGERKMAAEEVETCFVLRISQRHRSLKNTENFGCVKIYGKFFKQWSSFLSRLSSPSSLPAAFYSLEDGNLKNGARKHFLVLI